MPPELLWVKKDADVAGVPEAILKFIVVNVFGSKMMLLQTSKLRDTRKMY